MFVVCDVSKLCLVPHWLNIVKIFLMEFRNFLREKLREFCFELLIKWGPSSPLLVENV